MNKEKLNCRNIALNMEICKDNRKRNMRRDQTKAATTILRSIIGKAREGRAVAKANRYAAEEGE